MHSHLPADLSLLALLLVLRIDGQRLLTDNLGLMVSTCLGSPARTRLFNCKLLVGLDLDLSRLFTSFLRDERDLGLVWAVGAARGRRMGVRPTILFISV